MASAVAIANKSQYLFCADIKKEPLGRSWQIREPENSNVNFSIMKRAKTKIAGSRVGVDKIHRLVASV